MLNRVTFTGIDNRTSIEDLVSLQKEFPFVEFGILMSESLSNQNINNRYPHLTILKKLKSADLNLSCHVCGSAARSIIKENDWSGFEKLLKKDKTVFRRVQLNVSGIDHCCEELSFPEPFEFIIQMNSDHQRLFRALKDRKNVFGFQDNSGGKGEYHGDWLSSDEAYFGYAGGISEENVVEVLGAINLIQQGDFWIDMESSIRTNDWFDVEKCRRILLLCKPFMAS